MQDVGFGLLRVHLPRTLVNNDKRKAGTWSICPLTFLGSCRGASLASFEYLRLPLKSLFEFRNRRRLLRFGQCWVRPDHLDLVLDEGVLSLRIAA
jgi:hypothetical protein